MSRICGNGDYDCGECFNFQHDQPGNAVRSKYCTCFQNDYCIPYHDPADPYDRLPSNKRQVCVSPYSSSSDNLSYVTNLCNINKDCKGYYAGANDEWYIATDTDPLECNDRHINPAYTRFHSKESNYDITQLGLGYYGCQLKMSNICEESNDCQDYVEPLCNLDPKCTGYYTDAAGNYAATNRYPNDNDNDCQTYLYKSPQSDGFNTFSRKK